MQGQYSKLEFVTRRASKLLGNCKAGNICKELKKLKQQDKSKIHAHNTTLRLQVVDLKVELATKNKEIRQLRAQTESLEWIREVVGTPVDVLNKAHLFENDIKTKGQLSTAKIIPILVSFMMKMEVALVNIRKLVSGSLVGSSQAPPPPPKKTPRKEKPLEEVKTLLPQRPVKELVARLAKVEIPPAAIPSAAKKKKAEKDSDTKTTSSEPSSQRRKSRRKTKKEPYPELESEEESAAEDTRSSDGDQESEEEESTTPPPKLKKRMDTRASDKKKHASGFKSPVAPKRPSKIPQKEESS